MSLVCNSCNLTYNQLTDNLCIMCQIITEPSHLHTYSYLIGISNLEQLDIIKNTREFIQKNNRVPLPTEIDENAIIVKVNPYEFIQVTKLTNYFDNFKIFFTDDLNIKQIKTLRIFDKILKNKNQPIPNYILNSKEQKKYNKYSKNYLSIDISSLL